MWLASQNVGSQPQVSYAIQDQDQQKLLHPKSNPLPQKALEAKLLNVFKQVNAFLSIKGIKGFGREYRTDASSEWWEAK